MTNRRSDHCTHPNQAWCDCDWCRLLREGQWTPEVVGIDVLIAGAMLCPMCNLSAVVPLTKGQRAAQPDDTTHVCHPSIGGCNQGFVLPGFGDEGA